MDIIIRILFSSAKFDGIGYNFGKVGYNKAELMKVTNFDALQGLSNVKAEDYRNYLLMIAALNKRVKKPEFHAAISAEGKSMDKYELVCIADKWLQEMGYGSQPYLLAFHKDTDNNHLHMVSSRVDANGRKINDSFEKVRAVQVMNRIMGVDEKQMIEKAKAYRFTTIPQFKLILEKQGFIVKNNWIIRSGKKITEFNEADLKFSEPDKRRAQQLRAIFHKYKGPDLELLLKNKFGVELVFHSKDGKPVYGYTVIDHAQKNVFKGSDIMRLAELLNGETKLTCFSQPETKADTSPKSQNPAININISKDVDDDAVHGPRRKRKKKARTNLR